MLLYQQKNVSDNKTFCKTNELFLSDKIIKFRKISLVENNGIITYNCYNSLNPCQ